jgi:hypothetical protein
MAGLAGHPGYEGTAVPHDRDHRVKPGDDGGEVHLTRTSSNQVRRQRREACRASVRVGRSPRCSLLRRGRGWFSQWRRRGRRRLRDCPGALPEIRIRGTARGDQLRSNLRERLRRPAPLRRTLHDRSDAIDRNAVAGLRTAALESRLLAGRDDLSASAPSRRLRDGGCRAGQDHDADRANSKSMTLHTRHSGSAPRCHSAQRGREDGDAKAAERDLL